ncbi:hypothetical protein [Desulfocurvibacter africanus]|uniref:Uncharacterized protein n=1 Tax=Desulfocurvibacter africanus subsp. africanus str. Walvis Bay TaxID=690850 RepID=F3Z2S9_DESAF|nr:hypothetical protein [Desulfocurvibacter africanus]EGJ50246.1 hypothetical protein Desaf_1917 [Desulfocurvibacter africanus subsp. africanus str. Walvis Bay]
MSGDDISNLWSAIKELRVGQTDMGRVLARIEMLLSERCSTRASAHQALTDQVQALALRLTALERAQVRTSVTVGIGSALASGVAMAIVGALVRGWIG